MHGACGAPLLQVKSSCHACSWQVPKDCKTVPVKVLDSGSTYAEHKAMHDAVALQETTKCTGGDLRMRSCPPECAPACRVLVAEGKDALYVAFMGTKQRRDLLTNANAVLVPLWPATGGQGKNHVRSAVLPEACLPLCNRSLCVSLMLTYPCPRTYTRR